MFIHCESQQFGLLGSLGVPLRVPPISHSRRAVTSLRSCVGSDMVAAIATSGAKDVNEDFTIRKKTKRGALGHTRRAPGP